MEQDSMTAFHQKTKNNTYIITMKDLDFSQKIRARFYPIEDSDESQVLAADRYGGKKRSELKDSDFLDPKRRSFPIKSCQDVSDAVSAWGRYKGSMSFEEFKSKLTNKANRMNCSLPKKWENESDSGMKGGKSNYKKIDKKDLKNDNSKEKKEHYKDAIKDDKKQVQDLKKDERIDKEEESKAKSKKSWDKVDKKELKNDTKQEKKDHERDAIEDDSKKINKLKKGKPSEKKSVMIHDLKKDQKFDKKSKKKD